MGSRRFAISLHILVLLSQNKGQWMASDFIAGSININPVLVRKELSNLRKHGLIESKEGKSGGVTLLKDPETILLSDIYKIVSNKTILGNALAAPNQKCPVGRQINERLHDLSVEAEDILIAKLAQQTLADFAQRFK